MNIGIIILATLLNNENNLKKLKKKKEIRCVKFRGKNGIIECEFATLSPTLGEVIFMYF